MIQDDLTFEKIRQQVPIEQVAMYLLKPGKAPHWFYYPGEKTPSLKTFSTTGSFFDYGRSRGGSVIDLWQHVMHCSNYEALCQISALFTVGEFPDKKESVRPARVSPEPRPVVQTAADRTWYYYECRQRLAAPEAVSYLEKRGISYQTAYRFWLGYDEAADPACAPGGVGKVRHPCSRLIIPVSRSYYIGRAIDPAAELQKVNCKGGHPALFNERALWKTGTCFVTEGVFDCLSVIEAGGAAVALNSTSNVRLLLRILRDEPITARLAICLDNDPAGSTATHELIQGLRSMDIKCFAPDLTGPFKDCNEAWCHNPRAFRQDIAAAEGRRYND